MNKRLVAYMQGAVLLIEAACMTPALVIGIGDLNEVISK